MLTVHIIGSVGWIGAAAAYLALGIAAGAAGDPDTVRAAWIAMELAGWFVIVPLAMSALITGIALSVATSWGLLRHYWVVVSLALTALSLGVVLLHMPKVSAMAEAARGSNEPAVLRLGGEVIHPVLGLVVLTVITALNVHKPRGLTPYGARKQAEIRTEPVGG
jgi:uncharacterized membrane protein